MLLALDLSFFARSFFARRGAGGLVLADPTGLSSPDACFADPSAVPVVCRPNEAVSHR